MATMNTATKTRSKADAVRLRGSSVRFIPNLDFTTAGDSQESDVVKAVLAGGVESAETPAGLPPHLQRLCESDLLQFEEEQALFRAMNLRKFLANHHATQMDAEHATSEEINTIERSLSEAQLLREHLIKANMRLVMSIVKKFASNQVAFDEMLSDGLVALMNCVDKFDFDRGFRFSTYAYRSIARDLYRSLKTEKLRSTVLSQDGSEWEVEPADEQGSSAIRDGFWSHIREQTQAMIQHLDRRERFIIRCRYALGSHRKVKSLQFLADKLGVSKERVRQLEIRAVKKLRSMASEVELDDLAGSALL